MVKRDHGETARFVFSLAGGEVIEINEGEGKRGLYVIRDMTTVRQGKHEYPRVSFVHNNDARMKKEIQKDNAWIPKLLEPLRKMNCRKVVITPLGEVRSAKD